MRKFVFVILFLLSSALAGEAGVPGVQTVRYQLTNNAIFYVSTTGDDINGDGSLAKPWATIQRAYNWIADNLDFAGYIVQIQLSPGVYSYGVMITRPWVGGGTLTINGGGATINSNKPNVGIFDFVQPISLPGILTIQNMTLTSNVARYGINAECFCTVILGPNLVFGQFTYTQLNALNGGFLYCSAGYTINGGANAHYTADHGGYIQCPRRITVSGNPAFGSFAVALDGSQIDLRSAIFSGSARGQRYYVNTLSLLLSGGNLGAIPGSTAGFVGGGSFAN
jgi:hypothetical protein